MMVVALAATMSVGFTSCKEDDIVPPKPDYSARLTGRWHFTPIGFPVGYTIVFNSDGTYSYENPEQGSGAGNYKILKTLENQEARLENRDGDPEKVTLLIIDVTPKDDFDQLYVYYVIRSKQIAVDYFKNNRLLTGFLYYLTNYGNY